MGDRLATAKTLKFTAVTTYENPSRLGPALAYHTLSNVTLQLPNKLQVLSPGDGPASEFYYNGKTLVAFALTEDLVAIAEAPGTIDEALKFAYETAAIAGHEYGPGGSPASRLCSCLPRRTISCSQC